MFLDSKYFRWVNSFWFYERSWTSRCSSFFYLIGLSLVLLSLLDLRGPEERIKSNIPDQRTIIVIDSSASMLAEDVRPSRFVKGLQLARHFVKNAAGHQISIVLFSDIQKRLVPFTDDIDLLDSRLTALEKTNSIGGGSNISQAVAEAVQYFESENDNKSSVGNILVFTDAEESEGSVDADLGPMINLAIVGIGTAKGGNIPLRWEDGSFRGYKTFKGEPVITKLDEGAIKNFGKGIKNYRYWIVNSYSLPTDEIIGFFRSSFSKSTGKGDVRVRPVYSYYLLIPAILIYCLGIALGRFKTFRSLTSLLLLFMFASYQAKADEPEKPKLSPALKAELERMKAGKAERQEVLTIAEKLLREDQAEQAAELYQEYSSRHDDESVKFNRITALLKSGNLTDVMPLYMELLRNSKNEHLKDKLRNNLLLALDKKEKQKQQDKNKKDDEKQSKQDKKDKNDGKEGKEGQDSHDKKESDGKERKKQDKEKNKNGKNENQKPQDGKDNEKDPKDNEKKDPEDLKVPPRESKPQSLEEKEKMIEQKRKMVKTPAMVKQIMSDDRELQKRMMDTSTNERAEQKNKRDW